MKLAYPPIRLLDISQPTRQAMCKLGIGSLPEIADLKPDDLRYLEHREQVLRELVRLCVAWYLRPHWIKAVTIDMHILSSPPDGFMRISEEYALKDRWMLDLAIAQLEISKRKLEWRVVKTEDGKLTLWRKL